jgi:hypothetical protein
MKAVGWIENGEVRWLRQDQPAEHTTLFVESPPESTEGREVIGYTLEPIYEPKRGVVVTQAFIICHSCNAAVYAFGGPRYNAVCIRCAEHLNFTNLIKGK